MEIPHVVAGKVARASEQNTLIDQVNTNTTDVTGHETRISDLEAAIPKCVLRKNANQSIPDGTTAGDIVVTWQVPEIDTAGMRSGDTIVIPETGAYLVTANLNMIGGGTTSGDCVIYVTRNDAVAVWDASIAAFAQPGITSTEGVGNGLSTSTVRELQTGDVIRVLCWQGNGAARDLRYNQFGGCTFSVAKQV